MFYKNRFENKTSYPSEIAEKSLLFFVLMNMDDF